MGYIQTARVPWQKLRGEVAADDTFLTSFDYTDWPSSNTISLNVAPLQDASGLVIAMYGTNAENENANYEIYGRTRGNGPIQLLLKGVVTLGAQTLAIDPITKAALAGFWADTITVTGGIFSGLETILDSANDRICEIIFDQVHIEDMACYFTITDAGTASASMYAIISGW